MARAIAGWTDEFVEALPDWVDASPTPTLQQRELLEAGLVRADGQLTPFGHTIRYHLNAFNWQASRTGFDGALELADIGPSVRILDVGCGAGQSLRRLKADRPVELVGVDSDAAAVLLGMRLSKSDATPLTLVSGSAMAMPFADGYFDLVSNCVALNYMHQREALAEMVRVVRPGGFLFCRAESIWFDAYVLRESGGWKPFLGRARDLVWGTLHAATGQQPEPGTRLSGGRAFSSFGRMRRTLASLGCRVTFTGEAPDGPQIAGHRTQLILVAQKSHLG